MRFAVAAHAQRGRLTFACYVPLLQQLFYTFIVQVIEAATSI